MLIHSWLRACDRRVVRPLGRFLRGGGSGRGTRTDRVSRLERRVEDLERLVRELAGLAYLKLDTPASTGAAPATLPTEAREAA
jgi:hypothetical protein